MGEAQMKMQFLVAFIVIELLRWLVPRFMNKAVGTQYVTVESCENRQTTCGAKRDKAHDELVLLIKGNTTETRRTRLLIVKYLIRSGAAPEEIEEALGDS